MVQKIKFKINYGGVDIAQYMLPNIYNRIQE